jgi:putative membrane protein
MKKLPLIKHFSWRVLLLRVLANAAVLLITAGIVPNIDFVDRRILVVLGMALMLGVLNGVVKPIVQFLTLPFIFATYGVVVVLINAGLLWLLSVLFSERFAVDGWFWALLGGAVMGLLGSFLESLLGVSPPIVPENYRSLQQHGSRPAWATQTIAPQAAPPATWAEGIAVPGAGAGAAEVPASPDGARDGGEA